MARMIASFLLLVFMCCVPASARRGSDVTITYFANAQMTTVVGSVEYTCGGGIIRIGKTSRFHRSLSDSCGIGRMTPIALKTFARARNKVAECTFRCQRKYKIGLCTPDGCPWQDALKECESSCAALEAPPADR